MADKKVTISGFSMCRNADSLYYPVKESIESVLPIVDEFVVAIGEGYVGDKTRELIASINSPKIKIIDTVWDTDKFKYGSVHAQQTEIAMKACSGDWLLYLQADEIIHERDHSEIVEACRSCLNEKKVDGFLFNYLHFWGDFDHLQDSHVWYDREIRIVRNDPSIHSWKSAQSFRRYSNFDESKYLNKKGTQKLNVKCLKANIYHYGWVRPPALMTKKINALDKIHSHQKERQLKPFSYGDLSKISKFTGTHPIVMNKWIEQSSWENDGSPSPDYLRHNELNAKVLTWIEKNFLGGKRIFSNHNFNKL
jgi:glycosyltransferase involved in cell wall biosynthesis